MKYKFLFFFIFTFIVLMALPEIAEALLSCSTYKNTNWCGDAYCDPGLYCTGDNIMCDDYYGCICDKECVNNCCISKYCKPQCSSKKDTTWCGDGYCDPGTYCCGSNVMCSDGKNCDCNAECTSGICAGSKCVSCDYNPTGCQSDLNCADGKICDCNEECTNKCDFRYGTWGLCYTPCTGCLIGGVCYSNGTYDSTNKCRKCDTSVNTTDWTNVTAGTDPAGWCTASGCSNTGNCNGYGACETPGADTDPNSYCGAIDCDGGATKYYWGWSSDICYYRDDVSAADAHCNGSGSCKSTATECAEEPQGASTGVSYNSSCRSGCSGTTAPAAANNGSVCGSDLGPGCRYTNTCDAWYYKNTCSSGACTGATAWTTDATDNSACNGQTCATGKVCSAGNCITPCDSTSYTSCATAYDFGTAGGTKSDMCGEQYYKVSVPSGQTCDLTWTLSPGSGDYDLYTKWEGSCPTTGAYDCRSANGGTTADTCSKTTLAAGTYYALSHIYTSGKYSIQASLSNCQNVCSSLNYPTDKWQRVWYDISNNCLGNGPDGPNEEFSNDWGSGVLAYTRSDNIMFYSSKTIYFSSAGSYKFILGSDDGSELFIDGVSKINLWSDHGYTEKSTIMSLTAGNHQFRINYYERTGGAMLSFDILISGADLDCYNECTRRGYATGDCYKRNDFIEYHQCKETYSDYDAVGSYGSCSPNSIYNCECCHNCPTTPVNDSVSVGSCTLSITGTGNDATYPSYVPGFLLFNKDTNWRSYRMDEDRSDLGWCGNRVCGGIFHCYTGLGAKQSWTITGDQITIKTDTLSKDTSDDLGAGFNFNSGCKFTSVSANASTPELLLQTGTDSQQGSCLTGTKFYGIRRSAYASGYTQWTLDIEYCGDGECNCGETCTSCVGDCGSCDTTPPTTSISVKRKSTGLPPTESWLRADTYTIQFTDNDNVGGSGLRNCHYYINSCNANGSNCITPVVSDRTRPCGTPIDIPLGTSPYTLEGIRYLIYSYVYDNAGNRSTPDASVVLKTDFTPPGTEIR